jgi:8-oxo-dGTP pyrophosphatase MutT (NUDIX family)
MSFIESKIEALATAADLPQRLAEALRAGQISGSRRTRISPQLSYGRHVAPAPYTARAAAVLLMLFRRGGRWHLPLTERPAALAHHGGQISLPGGAVDAGEASSDAALRELREELGVCVEVELLGRLADCYVFASDFMITPWVAAAEFEPLWLPQACEVQSVVELPLELLLDERAIGRLTIERGPLAFHAPCIRVGTARVWGATSIILSELAGVLQLLVEND